MSDWDFQIGDVVASKITTGQNKIQPGDTGTVVGLHDYLVEVSWHGKAGRLRTKPEYGILDGSGWNIDEKHLTLVEPVGGAFTAPDESDLEDFFESV